MRMLNVDGKVVRVSVENPGRSSTPLLIFNGIGANIELLHDFRAALDLTTVVFDIPGVGSSPPPLLPYRFFNLASLAAKVLDALELPGQVDVMGISWGGLLAQQFAFQFGDRCRRLILAATSMGLAMVPARPEVLRQMVGTRRYSDRDFLRNIGPTIYGGAFRAQPELLDKHGHHSAAPSRIGYAFQLLAAAGWTSLPWLWRIRQPTIVLAGNDDPIIPLINGRIMARLLPRGRLEIIDDGHLFIVTQPEATAVKVQAFLQAEHL